MSYIETLIGLGVGCFFFLVHVKFAAEAKMLLMRMVPWPAAVSTVILKDHV